MIAVLGATGNTGSRIATTLLDRGHAVRVIARSADKLASLAARGADAVAADLTDAGAMSAALRGADAVYTMQPVDPTATDYRAHQRAIGEAVTEAIRAARVARVVALSALGAEQPAGTGFIDALREQEDRLRTLEDARVTALRTGAFFESFIPGVEAARELGVLADSVSPDVALPMVATRDVADVAVAELLQPESEPFAIREVLGPRDLTHPDVAAAFGLTYAALPYDEMAAALVDAGLSDDVARHHIDMTRAFNEGRVHSTLRRDGRSTTPTTIEEFAANLATAPVV
jgi:uncharacterized protein YbjT (DUF2867 family)